MPTLKYWDSTLEEYVPLSGAGPAGPEGPEGPQGPAGATGSQGPAGQGVPTGGTTDQVLAKSSATDYATIWKTISAGGGTLDGLSDVTITTPINGQVPTYTAGTDVWVGAPSVATASGGVSPQNAWDGNAGTEWHSTSAGAGWTRADFGTAKTVDKCRIQTTNNNGMILKLEWSDNDSTWTQVGTDMSIDTQPDDITITFAAQSHRYWRVYSSDYFYVYTNITLTANTGAGWINAAPTGQATSEKGQANGYAGLDAAAKVPFSQMHITVAPVASPPSSPAVGDLWVQT